MKAVKSKEEEKKGTTEEEMCRVHSYIKNSDCKKKKRNPGINMLKTQQMEGTKDLTIGSIFSLFIHAT